MACGISAGSSSVGGFDAAMSDPSVSGAAAATDSSAGCSSGDAAAADGHGAHTESYKAEVQPISNMGFDTGFDASGDSQTFVVNVSPAETSGGLGQDDPSQMLLQALAACSMDGSSTNMAATDAPPMAGASTAGAGAGAAGGGCC